MCLRQVYLRSNSILREDQEAWGQLLLGVMEANAAANRWFLRLFYTDAAAQEAPSADNETLENYLVWCFLVSCSVLVVTAVCWGFETLPQSSGRELQPSVVGNAHILSAYTSLEVEVLRVPGKVCVDRCMHD